MNTVTPRFILAAHMADRAYVTENQLRDCRETVRRDWRRIYRLVRAGRKREANRAGAFKPVRALQRWASVSHLPYYRELISAAAHARYSWRNE